MLLRSIFFFWSFRGARDADVVAFGQDVFRVDASIERAGETLQLATAWQRSTRRKKVEVDGQEPERLADALGKLGAVGRALAWTPAKLWPLGATSPGMWIDPPTTASLFSTSTGTTAISAIGTVLDTSNPVGLALDRKGDLALGRSW